MIDLTIFNPWWQDKTIDAELKGKRRDIFFQILKFLDSRQILILSGLRRAGKSTLMFQIIDELISKKNIDPYNILYFSFDEENVEIDQLIKNYEINFLRDKISKKEIYIFLDEIQKLNNWPSKVKILYDMHPKMKIFLSGSASINLMKGTRESLAGRFFDFLIEVFDFDEYLEFIGASIDREKENIFEVEIKRKLNSYIRSGGFVEAFDFNEEMQKKYFKEGLLERVVFKDLPGIYDINYPDLLFRLLKIIANQPGMLLDYKNMANDLKIDHRTLSSYIAYLEYAMLVQKVYNYSTNFLTSEKKLKKVYLSNTAFSISLTYNFDMSLILEQYFVNRFKARFFSRTPRKEEVDIVMESDMNAVPVEIKIRNKIDRSSLKPMLKFLKNVNQKEGYLITKDTEKIYSMDKYIIRAIPYWKYWSIKKIIEA